MKTQMDWQSLLNQQRAGSTELASDGSPTRTSFDRDGDRIIYASSFRRLQDKTQVFPLSQNDYVRTRLTHSLEVATVGRTLGNIAARAVPQSESTGIPPEEIASLTSAACLAHDLGNPPFGHSGEAAIQNFFLQNAVGKTLLSKLPAESQPDFTSFEGNAQGFRILTRTEFGGQGLKLTNACLASFTKYPFPSQSKAQPRTPVSVSNKKHGFHRVEQDNFVKVAAATGLIKLNDGWSRHPLAFLVEAADDICYRVIDVEDGYRQGVVSFTDAREALLDVLSPETRKRAEQKALQSDNSSIEYLRAKAITASIEAVGAAFKDQYNRIMNGQLDVSLIDASDVKTALASLKRIAASRIYSSPNVIMVELAGFEVLGGLLELYGTAMLEYLESNSAREVSTRSRNLIRTMPPAYRDLADPKKPLPSYLEAAHLLTDYVSGMTDTYAVSHYRKLKGIDLV